MFEVPKEAIEAGAKAWDKLQGNRYHPDEVDELSPEVKVILEAAYPYLAAKALDDAAVAFFTSKEALHLDKLTVASILSMSATKIRKAADKLG